MEGISIAAAVVVGIPAALVVVYAVVRVTASAFFNSKRDFERKAK
jgi:hypothetical protein